MAEEVLRLDTVSKSYRRVVALEPLDLTLRRGEIYGLVGENGAGKSTLIRIVNGLVKPTSGTVCLFGETDPASVRRQRSRVGYVPDFNASYPSMSARENLEIRCLEWGIRDKGRVERALGAVGLGSTGRKKVRAFSLGMRRRLDLAVALLGEPDLLVLDEPTNGLDPTGIVEVRELVKRLNRERGVTVLVSSHILAELHEMATQYLFLSHGKMVERISASELDTRCGSWLLLNVDDVERAMGLLRSELCVERLGIAADGAIRLGECLDRPHEVTGVLARNGVAVHRVSLEEGSLEAYYTQLVAEGASR